ncbi:MAG: undecaprenyldiphospho-muramoylpentapeptide beta-N-acetylglucosaminyltransferase [Lachnospiraceae bacterium]|nr:undecaprenyldiphospho-muramoylpentapeptide beta-N-acetylglucosaminyltransferase [Lachnospiraceae bacterium]
MKKIVLTGGGTAGHVTPNIALLPELKEAGFEAYYIGSYDGIEKRLIADYNIPYYGISTGKFRRYFDLKNFSDPFRVLRGMKEAKKILKEIRPDVVFSKGGFVAVPVVRAAASLKIPCVIHESDMTPGLANKLCIPIAKKICCNFPETMEMMPKNKTVLTGSPIRQEILTGDKARGKEYCGFTDDKPVLMVIGGSQGAMSINQTIREALPKILDRFNVVHLCGKDKVDNLMLNIPGYKQFEYVKDELKNIFALADIVVSRSGANAICEILALNKPNILIPLAGGRGDQLLNAMSFQQSGYSVVIKEEALDPANLIEKINMVYDERDGYIEAMKKSDLGNSVKNIISIIQSTVSEG